jgi:hypothetical protein
METLTEAGNNGDYRGPNTMTVIRNGDGNEEQFDAAKQLAAVERFLGSFGAELGIPETASLADLTEGREVVERPVPRQVSRKMVANMGAVIMPPIYPLPEVIRRIDQAFYN